MKRWQPILLALFMPVAACNLSAAAAPKPPTGTQVDPRLLHKVTLQEKGVSLTDFCAHLQVQAGVELRAARSVADEKVTVFVKEQRARDVMRAVARLFGYFWSRSGSEGEYRYTIEQDLKSQLAEEELRNRDLNAALLALDAQMQKYRPYLDMSFEQLAKRSERLFPLRGVSGGWGGIQLYHRLTPSQRTALVAGQELVFRPDAPNPDLRLPDEWHRPLLQSLGDVLENGQEIPLAEIPDARVNQIRLRLKRTELGQVSLAAALTVARDRGDRMPRDQDLATGRSPSVATPDNATTNAPLRLQSPFAQVVSLRPEPSCPRLKRGKPDAQDRNFYSFYSVSLGTLGQPHVFSGDVWEAVHRETGLSIIADFYTRMHRLDKVTVNRKPLFEGLCTVGDAMGVRWRKDGDFLLCRSTSFFWDKLKEVPNRYLQHWAQDRDANGGLPLADFLEMASLPDQQLESTVVGEAIGHCWSLPEWRLLDHPVIRHRARLVAMLTPEQLQRAMQPAGIPFQELTPAQQQVAVQDQYQVSAFMERQNGDPYPVPQEWWSHAAIFAEYAPAGWYVWDPPERRPVPLVPTVGRTAAEALSAARLRWPQAPAELAKVWPRGYFSAGVRFSFPN
jgi:hypothetical protein